MTDEQTCVVKAATLNTIIEQNRQLKTENNEMLEVIQEFKADVAKSVAHIIELQDGLKKLQPENIELKQKLNSLEELQQHQNKQLVAAQKQILYFAKLHPEDVQPESHIALYAPSKFDLEILDQELARLRSLITQKAPEKNEFDSFLKQKTSEINELKEANARLEVQLQTERSKLQQFQIHTQMEMQQSVMNASNVASVEKQALESRLREYQSQMQIQVEKIRQMDGELASAASARQMLEDAQVRMQVLHQRAQEVEGDNAELAQLYGAQQEEKQQLEQIVTNMAAELERLTAIVAVTKLSEFAQTDVSLQCGEVIDLRERQHREQNMLKLTAASFQVEQIAQQLKSILQTESDDAEELVKEVCAKFRDLLTDVRELAAENERERHAQDVVQQQLQKSCESVIELERQIQQNIVEMNSANDRAAASEERKRQAESQIGFQRKQLDEKTEQHAKLKEEFQKLEKYSDSLNQKLTAQEQLINELQNTIETTNNQLTEQQQNALSQTTRSQDQVEKLQEALGQMQGDNEELVGLIQQAEDEIQNLKRFKEQANSEIALKDKQIQQIQEQHGQKCTQLQGQLEQLTQAHQKFKQEHDTLLAAFDEKKSLLANAENTLKAQKSELQFQQQLIDSKEASITLQAQKIDDLQQQLAETVNAKEEVEVELDQKRNDLTALTLQVNELRTRLGISSQQQEKDSNDLKKQLGEMQTLIQQKNMVITELEAKAAKQQHDTNAYKTQLDEINNTVLTEQQQTGKRRSLVDQIERMKEECDANRGYRQRAEGLEMQLRQMEKECDAKVRSKEDEVSRLNLQLQQYTEKFSQADQLIERYKQTAADVKNKFEDKMRRIKQSNAEQQQLVENQTFEKTRLQYLKQVEELVAKNKLLSEELNDAISLVETSKKERDQMKHKTKELKQVQEDLQKEAEHCKEEAAHFKDLYRKAYNVVEKHKQREVNYNQLINDLQAKLVTRVGQTGAMLRAKSPGTGAMVRKDETLDALFDKSFK